MTKVIEKNVAEIIVLIVLLVIMMSSCGSVKNTCAAYASTEVENNSN